MLHNHASGRSDDLPSQENVFQTECLDLLPIFFSFDQILSAGAFYGFNNIFIEIPTAHTEQDFQIIRFNLGSDFFDHFCSAVCGTRVAAAYKSSDISLQFVAESKLQVVTAISRLFGVVSLERSLLVTFHIDYTAVNINGDGFALALS